MKKNLLKMTAFSFVMLCGLSFTACSDDSSDSDPLAPVGTDPSTIASANLVAYMPFEDNATDKIGAMVATPTNATYATGQRGKAFQGSATGFITYAIASTSKLTNMKSGWTFAMWIKEPKIANGAGCSPIIALNGGLDKNMGGITIMQQDYDVNTNINFKFSGHVFNTATIASGWTGQDWTSASPSFPSATWIHLVCEYDQADSSSYKIYSNGKLISKNKRFAADGGVTLGDFTWAPVPTKLYIGKLVGVAENNLTDSWAATPFTGMLDEVRIYNKALTATEVDALFTAEKLQVK